MGADGREPDPRLDRLAGRGLTPTSAAAGDDRSRTTLTPQRQRTGVPVEAAAVYAGDVPMLIKALKYDGRLDAADALGAVVLAHLDAHFRPAEVDLVVGNPSHVGRRVLHVELVLRAAAAGPTGGRWPFDDAERPTLVKRYETPTRSRGGDDSTRRVAAAEVYRALGVERPERVRSRRVVVVDDVALTGGQLAEVGQRLRDDGAADVRGLVIAAAPEARVRFRDPAAIASQRLAALAGAGTSAEATAVSRLDRLATHLPGLGHEGLPSLG